MWLMYFNFVSMRLCLLLHPHFVHQRVQFIFRKCSILICPCFLEPADNLITYISKSAYFFVILTIFHAQIYNFVLQVRGCKYVKILKGCGLVWVLEKFYLCLSDRYLSMLFVSLLVLKLWCWMYLVLSMWSPEEV